MEPKAKRPARDLSDLKARLGIAKPGDGTAPKTGVQAGLSGPVGTGPGLPVIPQGHTSPGTPFVPPGATGPGLPVVPPGTSPAYPTATPVEPRRDPYATVRPAAAPAAAPIVDAGPQLDIPEQKKSKLPLMIGLLAVAVIALGGGYVFGRISHARMLYNKTLDNANKIRAQVEKMADFEQKVVTTLASSTKRNGGKIKYDDAVVRELKELEQSPIASPEGRKRLETALFRTNYAMMDDLLITRLFSYYNNTLRLMDAIGAFVNHAAQQKEEVLAYEQASSTGDRNFGIVVSEAKGNFYLGSLVELGQWICPDKRATAAGRCQGKDVTGFQVRPPGGQRWAERPGNNKRGPLGIVVPITPDKSWQSVATARRGYLDFGLYVQRYRNILRISALLAKGRQDLVASLKKQAGHDRVFTL